MVGSFVLQDRYGGTRGLCAHLKCIEQNQRSGFAYDRVDRSCGVVGRMCLAEQCVELELHRFRGNQEPVEPYGPRCRGRAGI